MIEIIKFWGWLSGHISGFASFFSAKDFLVPFLSTLMASLTIIFLQFSNRRRTEKKKKIYAVGYISDVISRTLMSDLIIKKHTILPHIEATKRILQGDKKLLDTLFLADEFDVLTDPAFSFNHLSEDYKILLGYDSIDLVQMFETINYLNENSQTRSSFKSFVKENLKSRNDFLQKNESAQTDILNTYWDYLDRLDHEQNRIIHFIVYITVPAIEKYMSEGQFRFYSKKSIAASLDKISALCDEYSDILPASDYLLRSKEGGIQKVL